MSTTQQQQTEEIRYLIDEKANVEKAHPGLAQSFNDFRASFAKFRQMQTQFSNQQQPVKEVGAKYRV